MSGTARLFGAGTVFILMAFGMAIGNQIGKGWPDTTMAISIMSLPLWTEWLAVIVGSISLVILFQARIKDTGWVILGGLVAFATVKYASVFVSNALAAFLGAIAVGACANLVSRFKGIPGAVVVVPGFIMLVPGSVGFKSLTALLEHDVVAGLNTAFDMVLVGISLVSGLLISSLVTLPQASEMHEIETEL